MLCEPREYPPGLGHVRDLAIRIERGIPSVAHAWRQVLAAIKSNSVSNMHPAVKKALGCVSDIYSLRQKTDLGFDRAFFKEAYAEEIRDYTMVRYTERQLAAGNKS